MTMFSDFLRARVAENWLNRVSAICYMPDFSSINILHGRHQARSVDFDRWYAARPEREDTGLNWDEGMGAIEWRGGLNVPNLQDIPVRTTTTREALRREITEALASEVERHQRVAFESELMRRATGLRFRQAYIDRQFANMTRAYHQEPILFDWSALEARAFLGMFPVFEDEEQAREWFESMGATWPAEGPNPWSHVTVSKNLKSQAKTLRERAFARIFQGLTPDNSIKLFCAGWEGSKSYELALKGKGLRNVMAAARRDPEARRHLATLPISYVPRPGMNANDELVDPLQDLADIIVHEITLAYQEEYYPRPVGVDALTDEHVRQVMKAMQREINREHRGVRPAKLEEDLSWERQVTLAERRRNWFARFGITPRSWRTGRWSLWKVPNEPFPEGYPTEKRYTMSVEGTPVDVANDQDNGPTMIGPEPNWADMMRAYTMRDRALAPGQADTVIIDEPFGRQPLPFPVGDGPPPENDGPRMLRLLGTVEDGTAVVVDETEND